MLSIGSFQLSTEFWVCLIATLLFALQLFLCFKVKRIWLRILPTIIAFATTVVFSAMIFITDGWDAIGYLILALCAAIMTAVTALALIIYAIITAIRKRKGLS